MTNALNANQITDTAIAEAIALELDRQMNQIELIASENIVSLDVLRAQGSVLMYFFAFVYKFNG